MGTDVIVALISVLVGGLLGFFPTYYSSKKDEKRFLIEKKIEAYVSAKKSMANHLINFQTMSEEKLQEEANESISKMDLFAANDIKKKYVELFHKWYLKRKELEGTENFKETYLKCFGEYEKEYEELVDLMRNDLGIK